MRAFVLAALVMTGCVDDGESRPDPRELPACVDLGCENTFCTSDGLCACEGEPCRSCEADDSCGD